MNVDLCVGVCHNILVSIDIYALTGNGGVGCRLVSIDIYALTGNGGVGC